VKNEKEFEELAFRVREIENQHLKSVKGKKREIKRSNI
jgi:hypothetical protein